MWWCLRPKYSCCTFQPIPFKAVSVLLNLQRSTNAIRFAQYIILWCLFITFFHCSSFYALRFTFTTFKYGLFFSADLVSVYFFKSLSTFPNPDLTGEWPSIIENIVSPAVLENSFVMTDKHR